MKKPLSFLASLLLALSLPVTSYAKLASSSDAKTEIYTEINEEIKEEVILDKSPGFLDLDEAGIMLLADNLPSVENTVKLQYVTVMLKYYDMSSVVKSLSAALTPQGYFSFSRPSDFVSIRSIDFSMPRSAMPSRAGTYMFSVRFGSNVGVTYKDSVLFWTGLYTDNVSEQESKTYVSMQQFSGDFYFRSVMNYSYSYDSNFHFLVYPKENFIFPYGGYISMNFSSSSSSEESSYTTSINPPSSGDIQENISSGVETISNGVNEVVNEVSEVADNTNDIKDNTAELVNQQVQTNNLIAQIIQTISCQLEAFWNQLAGEFTNLYNKMNTQHDEKLKADKQNTDDMMDNASQNASDMMDNDDKNTNNIMNNQNDNRNHLENGYDSSSLTNENNKLNRVLDEYNQAEDTLLKDTKSNLNNFVFDNPFTQFTVVLLDISSILDGIYNSLGSFNIPIGFSLTLTIAMLCIGWYRFKGGA